jgi:hypothetical protein
MLHILFSFLIVTLSLLISIRLNGVGVGYLALSWIPAALLLIAFLYEKAVGFRRFSEVMYHFSYDASYLLVLAGILMLLLAVIRHRAKKLLLLGSLFSALPIIVLIISQSL